SRAARAVEKRSGRDRSWTDDAAALADRLDLGSLAADLAGRNVATLLIGGAKDRVVPPREITSLRDLLRRHDTGPVESATFRMGHALAAEPGTEARPPITEAVRVDGVLTDWFRERLAASSAPAPEDTTALTTQPINRPSVKTWEDASAGDDASSEPANVRQELEGVPAETALAPGDHPPAGGDGTWSTTTPDEAEPPAEDTQEHPTPAECGFDRVR
ncbi:MAG: hypothetical protein ACRDNL_24675, partial [Spirillospora sp.]